MEVGQVTKVTWCLTSTGNRKGLLGTGGGGRGRLYTNRYTVTTTRMIPALDGQR